MSVSHLLSEPSATAPKTQKSSTASPFFRQEPIAIIGLACRLPGGVSSPQTLWELLERGGIASTAVPEDRFNAKGHYDGSMKPGTMRPPGGMFLGDVDLKTFDAPFFEISRAEAVSMDPNQRQLLEVVYEGLENAGLPLHVIDSKPVGCFVASYAADYHDMQSRDPGDRPPSIEVGIGRSILSNRISHFLNIKGPSVTIDTACSGSLVGLDMACRYLQTGEVEAAIVAASNLYLSPEHVMDTGPIGQAHSPTGRCHTFDAKADGYIKAEAVNSIILKRLDDAIRDRDPIRAVIRGSATNSDGRTPGIASPNSAAQAAATRAAYANAGLTSFAETSYLECHGTGTPAGDPLEVSGVSSVFASSRPVTAPLVIGSIKSNIGHSEAAAGLSGLIKATLAIEHGTIPGNPTFLTPNPKIDFEALRVTATRVSIPWPKCAFRRASINSFGYGGTNSHVILDEVKSLRPDFAPSHVSSFLTPEDDIYDEEESSHPYTLLFSANDSKSLQAYTEALDRHMSSLDVRVRLRDLAYTLSERRSHHFHRGYIVARGSEIDAKSLVQGKKTDEQPRIGFVFTGQGAQWSQMGKGVIERFPNDARPLLERLDRVLQSLPTPPDWSLVRELTETRTSEHLRLPEFSQPLVTALQLVLVQILRRWNIEPECVVGHSSGEIAAAYAAGYLSEEDAIKTAFYRGQSAKNCRRNGQSSVGMLAVGLGPDAVSPYLDGVEEEVQIACYNSPGSVTLSGLVPSLEEVKERLVAQGHFARLLLVDLAYHSKFMADIGQDYEQLLKEEVAFTDTGNRHVKMFSSVSGKRLDRSTDALYWKTNMISPVRFSEACREMLSGRGAANFLIEIGPSGALAGPVSQIKDSIGAEGRSITYAAGLTRGMDSVVSMFTLAGKLFVAGAPVNFIEVNNEQIENDGSQTPPSIIVDLPNYVWNHTNQYWHESQASKDWRFREFPEHDLLGSKVLASPWNSPSFRKTLLLERLPWLRDHNMGGDIILPASGYISMAIEAIFQKSIKQRLLPAGTLSTSLQYRMRNVKFDKALVLEEGVLANVSLTMNPLAGAQDTWHEFHISSTNGETSLAHCTGLVRLDTSHAPVPSSHDLSPLVRPASAHLWYKAQSEIGYGFGPSFQKTLLIETWAGQRISRCTTLLEEPQSSHSPQSPYPMHPACIDGCFQTVTPSLWSGERPSINAVLVPATLDNLIIYPKVDNAREGLSVASSHYNGRGRIEESKNFYSNCTVFDPETSLPLLKMQGLRYHKLDTGKDVHRRHTYNRMVWRPDITFLTQDQLHALAQKTANGDLQTFIDLVAHKKPSVKVLEISCAAGDSTSLWFAAGDAALRGGYEQYSYMSSDAKALLTAKEDLQVFRATSFDLFDVSKNVPLTGKDYGFVIVKVSQLNHDAASNIALSIRPNLAPGAVLLLLEISPDSLLLTTPSSSGSDNGSGSSVVIVSDPNSPTSPDDENIDSALTGAGFDGVLRLPQDWAPNAYFATVLDETVDNLTLREVNIVHLTGRRRLSDGLKDVLRQTNWKVTEHVYPYLHIQPKSIVLVLEESSSPLLKTISERQWESVRSIILQGCHLLWVSEGSQMSITNPDNALVHGMFRTIRAEDRTADLVTLDVEYGQGPSAHLAIERLLRRFTITRSKTLFDSEFAERGSILYISRVIPDELVNAAKDNDDAGGAPVTRELRDVEGVARLQTERIGTLDSLCYSQQSSEDEPILDFHIEVDMKAAGLNFKDVAVTMGLVPENEHLLGLEGAGIVRRVGKGASKFRVGDRVAILKNGTFANRIQCPIERAHHIPETMSFVDAATIPLVYLTSMYSLFDIGGLKYGQSVLIHSAAGGVGLSAIQLAQWVGAEIFVTVGTQKKRDFLHHDYGIPYDRMFSSRTTDFGAEVLAATGDKGIDVILNSLTGELLDESWRICADGGHMVEIGKKDIVDRNFLSMEPFDRNCSYHGVDFSYSKQIKDTLIQDLLKRTFKLVNEGHIKPIHPQTVYSFSDIPSSFAYMRTARHIGKIVIADDEDSSIAVPIRPPRRTVKLDPGTSYAIVGGLKGLCGSLAIYLAKYGAKNIVAMSRSGCSDDRSQNIIANCRSLGCTIEDAKVDVTDFAQVKSALQKAKYPVRGIIQGAMVLRDKPYEMMTVSDFHTTLSNKVDGTWNLHNASLELKQPLKFFTLLSSISGVIGQKGQANYSAANVFLDAFATYRLSRGLPANSVNLGVIEDVGYVAEQGGMQAHFDDRQWIGINERVLHKILGLSILQQTEAINATSVSQLITGIPVPQPASSELIYDARFAALFRPESDGDNRVSATHSAEKDVQALLLLRSSGAEASTLVDGAVAAVGAKFERTLRLSDPVEPAKSLSAYGLDSLSAVELRNWIRAEIGVEVTMLEITNASSLISLCEKIIRKMLG